MPEPKRTAPFGVCEHGLEYPEIQKFVKYFAKWLERQYEIPVDLKVLTPELTFPEVLTKYGYPVIGKEVAKVIYYAGTVHNGH